VSDLDEAIVLYLGWDRKVIPRLGPYPARLVERFGTEYAAALEKDVRVALRQIDELLPDFTRQNLDSAADAAVKRLAALRPDLGQETLAALRNAYWWGYA
jgi:hypothetical protein